MLTKKLTSEDTLTWNSGLPLEIYPIYQNTGSHSTLVTETLYVKQVKYDIWTEYRVFVKRESKCVKNVVKLPLFYHGPFIEINLHPILFFQN